MCDSRKYSGYNLIPSGESENPEEMGSKVKEIQRGKQLAQQQMNYPYVHSERMGTGQPHQKPTCKCLGIEGLRAGK